MVKARFWVQRIIRFGNTDHIEVNLSPVVRSKPNPGAEGNTDWAKYTPSGEIRLNISAAGAQTWFEDRLGKDVAITFEDIVD